MEGTVPNRTSYLILQILTMLYYDAKLFVLYDFRIQIKNAKAKTTFGRKSAISIVASYNQTDWTSGWNHFIQGCTIFINPEFEVTLDWVSHI